jgi:hypothetical protein
MKKVFLNLITMFCMLLIVNAATSATYYIRPDGGDSERCNGTVDAPDPGSATNQDCAWSHPFWSLDGNGAWKIQRGDTLFIYPGSYQMGFGAPNTSGWCSSEGTWVCYLPPLPSGSNAQNPTRILGKGWDSGCANPPELWGTQRADFILNLNGTSNAVIDCLEITDHSGCVESHPNSSVACQRDTYPYGDWALLGIYAADSSNVTLRHLNIHGLAHTGIRAGRLTDWTVEDVRIAGNGMAGWDGDLQEGVNLNSNQGTLTFKRLTVEWSGCAESYPEGQKNNCWGQSVGGYGDGFGQGGLTGGHWIIEDSVFRYNTQDGIDMLYVRENNSQIEIRRTQSYGNAGDQIKVNGSTRIENSLMVSNCGYFNGKSFTYNVGDCRAGGSALVFSMRRGSKVSVVNSTLVGQGDCLLIVQCDTEAVPPCDGSETAIIQNNIFQGHQEFGTDDMTCDVWFDRDNFYQTQEDYNVIHPDTKLGEFQHGSHDIFQDPLFVNANLETFDGDLQAGSPAIDTGLPVGSLSGLIPSNDLTGATRPYGSGVDRGAYEYGGSTCSYSISPTGQSFSVSGGSDTVNVTAPSGCLWTAASNANWIIITSGTSGSGNGSVNYTVSPNTGPDRMGTLNIGGRTFTVSQTGVPQAETVSTPTRPDGPTSGIIGTSYDYSTGGSSSSVGHSIEYRFDWGDGTNSGWSSLQEVSKSWSHANNCLVRAQARCANHPSVESGWSDPLTVTISAVGPDLTGEWTTQPYQTMCRSTIKGAKCTVKGTFTIKNIGNRNASSTYVSFYLSDDDIYDGEGAPFKRLSTGKIKVNMSKPIKLNYNFSFPVGGSSKGKYIIAVIEDDSLGDIDEANNIILYGPIP